MKTRIRHPETRGMAAKQRNAERGVTLVMVAGGLALILAAAALSIDLGTLYLERSEAQRAADAGALAGAQVWANDSCALDASCLSAGVEATVTARAKEVAQQNLIFGQTPTIPTPTFASGGGSQTDPLVTVVAQAPAKTFFLPLASGATISATATAEAYSPNTTSGPTICDSCLKPFFVPNCDPNHASPVNTNCPAGTGLGGGTPAAFFSNGTIANSTSILGETWQLHLQTAGKVQAVPSQWLEVDFSLTPPNCSGSGGSQSKTTWQLDVTQCSTKTITCGTQLCTLNGFAVGPNDKAVCQMISYGGSSCNANGGTAVDSVDCSSGTCIMTAGFGNPFAPQGTRPIYKSASLVAVPVYDGTLQSGGGAVTVVGYMQLFIQDIKHQGNFDNIDAVIVSATTCGNLNGGSGCSDPGGGSGTSGTASGGGATLVPVRLVHQ